MNNYKNIIITDFLKKVKDKSSLDLSEINHNMFCCVDEFKYFVHNVIPNYDSHFYIDKLEPTSKFSTNITLDKYNYFSFSNNDIDKSLKSYYKLLKKQKHNKYVLSMYGIKNIVTLCKYIYPFSNSSMHKYGYNISLEKKLKISDLYTINETIDLNTNNKINYTELVIFANDHIAHILACLLPDAKIYLPSGKLFYIINGKFEEDHYSIRVDINEKFNNIIFGLPDKKYWPINKI